VLGFDPALYPRSLKMLISLAAVLPLSLAALIASSTLQMYGIAYDIPQLVYGSELLERPTWILLGFASAIAGGIAFAGLLCKGLWASHLSARPTAKVKNTEIAYDTHVVGLLESLSKAERDLLRQALAESRLAIRHDGVLIAREQAEMMRNIEEFLIL